VNAVAAARTVLAEHAAATEEQGRPTAESRAAAEAVGAFAVTTPAEYGGLDADHRTMVRLFTELGAGCASTAWTAVISAVMKSFLGDWMTPAVRQALYTDPNVQVCGNGKPEGRGEKVDGGYLIEGRWAYASGCLDAGWAMVAIKEAAGIPADRPVAAVLPTASLHIDRTWDGAIGLRGTNSHTLVAERIFVADDFMISPPAPSDVTDGPLPAEQMLPGLLHSVSPLLGATKGALDLIAEFMTAQRPVAMSPYTQRSQSPSARALFVEATESVSTAEMRALRVAEMLDGTRTGDHLSEREIAHARMQLVTALRECRCALDTVLDLRGSSALVGTNPLNRAWRDVAMGSRHVALNPFVTADHLSSLLFPEVVV
jgi:alkylation response protein AidB-like acyl-CoA dehydrogenase